EARPADRCHEARRVGLGNLVLGRRELGQAAPPTRTDRRRRRGCLVRRSHQARGAVWRPPDRDQGSSERALDLGRQRLDFDGGNHSMTGRHLTALPACLVALTLLTGCQAATAAGGTVPRQPSPSATGSPVSAPAHTPKGVPLPTPTTASGDPAVM